MLKEIPTVPHYETYLREQTVKTLREAHKKTFPGRSIPKKFRKEDFVTALLDKFKELHPNPEAKPTIAPTTPDKPATVSAPKTNHNINGHKSRRSLILEEIEMGIWDSTTLAEALILLGEWPDENKNKSAISGTITSARRDYGWTIKIDEKGRICVSKQ